MKTMLIAASLLALPFAAPATVAMESQQATQPPHEEHPAHRQLFTVKYVLRLAPPEQAPPEVVMEGNAPEIAPPAAGSVPALMLGAVHRDPNAILCFGWGCENER